MEQPSTVVRSFRRDRLAWLFFVLFLLVSISGGSLWMNRTIIPEGLYAANTETQTTAIAVLSYEHVVEKSPDGTHVDRARFREHLQALRNDGFHSINLSALSDFLYNGKALPSKPVLITFDTGYLDTFSVVDPVLRQEKWRAALFLKTIRQENRDTHFLYWDRLQRMVNSGIWEIASYGHQGTDLLSLETDQKDSLLFSIGSDYEKSRLLIDQHLKNHRVTAYALSTPIHSKIEEATEESRLTRKTLKSSYLLGFVDDPIGSNPSSSDPYHLRRLRVSPSITGEQLIQHLHAAMNPPSEVHAGNIEKAEAAQWLPLGGAVRTEANTTILEGSPSAQIILTQSHWTQDWVLETDLKMHSGQFWLMQTAPDTLKKWRIGGDLSALYLQHFSEEGLMETLARIPFPEKMDHEAWHHLRIIKRGQGLSVEWDHKPLGEHPYYLAIPWRGALQWVAWNTEQPARLHLANQTFAAFRANTQVVQAYPSPETVQSLVKDSRDIGTVLPFWIEINGDTLNTLPMDHDLFLILSRRQAWEILPLVRIKSTPDIRQVNAPAPHSQISSMPSLLNDILNAFEKTPWKGLYFDFSLLDTLQQRQWVEALETLQAHRKDISPQFQITPSSTSVILTLTHQ